MVLQKWSEGTSGIIVGARKKFESKESEKTQKSQQCDTSHPYDSSERRITPTNSQLSLLRTRHGDISDKWKQMPF